MSATIPIQQINRRAEEETKTTPTQRKDARAYSLGVVVEGAVHVPDLPVLAEEILYVLHPGFVKERWRLVGCMRVKGGRRKPRPFVYPSSP